MAERPILFSGPMVRALMDGRKSQTRRVVTTYRWHYRKIGQVSGVRKIYHNAGITDWEKEAMLPSCPYGQPGDLLWVREAFHIIDRGTVDGRAVRTILYRATGDEVQPTRLDHPIHAMKAPKAYPSLFMPRGASRLMLRVTSVRVERLQAISEEDAQAEGVERCPKAGQYDWRRYTSDHPKLNVATARASFCTLWESINGKKAGVGWSDNPWVWVVGFECVEGSGT